MIALYPKNETLRLERLRQSGILDTPVEDAYDDFTRLAALTCEMPIAAITLIDSDRQWFKSILGAQVKEISRDISFCAHTILQTNLLEVTDTRQDPRFADNPFVQNAPYIRFYAGVPLITADGCALGSLCVFDTVSRVLTSVQRETLQLLGRQVSYRLQQGRVAYSQERLIAEYALDNHELRRSEELFRNAFSQAAVGMTVTDTNARYLFVNEAFCQISGYTEEELLANHVYMLTHPDDHAATSALIDRLTAGEIPNCVTEKRHVRKDNRIIWVRISVSLSRDTSGRPGNMIALVEDITTRKNAEEDRQESERRLRLALETGKLGSWLLDLTTGQFTELSLTCKAHFGLPPDAERDKADFYNVVHCEDRDRIQKTFLKAIAEHHDAETEYRCIWPDDSVHWINAHGRPVYDSAGNPLRMIGVTRDVTERKLVEAEREQALVEAQERADHDPLTNLLNHRAFHSRLAEESNRSVREQTTYAVAMLDLDNFKYFNDAHGHIVGDIVLRQVADRLQQICRHYDTPARFGGDEFALLIPHVNDTTASQIEARLCADLQGLTYHSEVEGLNIPIGISIGVALFPAHGADRQEVLRQADARLMRAKTGGNAETEADRVRAFVLKRVEGFSMLDSLVTAVDNKDRYTRRHSEDVMAYSLMIGKEIGLDKAALHTVAVAALLHDVGKIGIPDSILRKPGRLTEEEFAAMKNHPQMGAIMVNSVPGLEDTVDAVRFHHERWDGEGYPFGLKGFETPQIARLMAVADAFSAMTTDRPYRQGMDTQQALTLMQKGAGTQWDPQFVDAFLKSMTREGSLLNAELEYVI